MRNLISAFLLLVALTASAQKLPNKQEKSIWAPANIKIDGKTSEWNDQFQAYNNATEINYTIANDAENIYLVIQATKSRIIEKLMEGGVEFTVNTNDKKGIVNNVNVLFPLLSMPRAQGILLAAGKQINQKNYLIHIPSEDTAYIAKQAASILRANKLLDENLKDIKVSGITAIEDTVPNVTDKTPYYSSLPLRDHHYKIISIVNKDGIAAGVVFDDDGNLNYELSIPQKYIQTVIGNTNVFNYRVTIHGRGEDRRIGDAIQFGPPINGVKEKLYMDLETATDFKGEYTLAKAP